MDRAAPIVIRIFKEERTLEVWKQDRTGKFGLLQSWQYVPIALQDGPCCSEQQALAFLATVRAVDGFASGKWPAT